MRLIIAVVRDVDSEAVLQALLKENFRVTRISSTGGFMRRGNATMLIGVETEKVQAALALIRSSCSPVADPGIKRVSVFVLKIDRFEQIG